MGRIPLQGDKLELLTTNLQYSILVGEAVARCLMEKDLLVEGDPPHKDGRARPLCNLSAWVNFLELQISGKDAVEIRGAVEGKALFYGEAGPREVSFTHEAFYQEVEVPGAMPGMEASGHGRISYIAEEGPPLEAEGKLLYRIKLEIEVLLAVTDARQLTAAVGAKNVPTERLERHVVVFEELLKEQAYPLTLSSDLAFPGELTYLKLLSAYLTDFDWQQHKEKIQVQGNLVTHYYFNTGTHSGFSENRQFFKEDLPFTGPEQKGRLTLFPVVEYAASDLQGERARQRAYLDIFLRATRQVQQEVLLEIEGVDTYKEYVMLSRAAGVTGEALEIVQRIQLPYPKEIAAGPSRLCDLQLLVDDDGIAVTGTLERHVYYIPEDDNGMDTLEEGEMAKWPLSFKVEESFQQQLHLPGARAGDTAVLYTRAGKCEFAPAEAATLQISHAVLEIKVRQMEEYAIVVPSRVPPGTSMVIYTVRKEDNLLKISRNYGVKAAQLAQANGLVEEEPLIAGQKLLIPLMLYRR